MKVKCKLHDEVVIRCEVIGLMEKDEYKVRLPGGCLAYIKAEDLTENMTSMMEDMANEYEAKYCDEVKRGS